MLLASSAFPIAAKGVQHKQPVRVRIILCDNTGVESGTLRTARNVASRVIMSATVEIDWIDVGSCDSSDPSFEPSKWPADSYYLIAILPDVLPNSATTDVMGFAPVTTGRYPPAYIFYNRVRSFSDLVQGGIAIVLGHVIAHEMGHLLLPANAHSKSGIMRPSWDFPQWKEAAAGRLVFTESQVREIRKQFRTD